MKIFLDDIRQPTDWLGYDDSWCVVRTFVDFVTLVTDCHYKHTRIEIISFDNDLGVDQPEGYECAKWLTEQQVVPAEVWVHSSNVPAKENIYHLMRNWQRFNKLPPNVKRVYLQRIQPTSTQQ